MAVKGQLAMDETVIEDTALEAALEDRERAREARRPAQLRYDEADRKAKAEVERAVPADVIARVGRFRIERKTVEGHSVSFATEDKVRVVISAEDGE